MSKAERGTNRTHHRWRLKQPGRLGVIALALVLALAAELSAGAWPFIAGDVVLAGGAGGGVGRLAGPTEDLKGVVTLKVTVEPGDTLWTLALRYYPGMDPRVGVARIRKINGLAGGTLYAGQELILGNHPSPEPGQIPAQPR